MNDFIKMLDGWFGQKAPQLPRGFKEFLVKIAPYLAIIAVVFSLPAIFMLLGFGSMYGGYMMYGYGIYGRGMMYGGFMGGQLWMIFSLVTLVLYALAIPGLFRRQASGWNYSFYAVLVCGAQNLLSFNLVGLVVGLAIGFYVLFQVKPYYFGGATISTPPPAQTPPKV